MNKHQYRFAFTMQCATSNSWCQLFGNDNLDWQRTYYCIGISNIVSANLYATQWILTKSYVILVYYIYPPYLEWANKLKVANVNWINVTTTATAIAIIHHLKWIMNVVPGQCGWYMITQYTYYMHWQYSQHGPIK